MKRLLIGIFVLSMCACNSDNKPDEQAFLESLEAQHKSATVISNEVLESILQQIPSPLEISVLLKESGTKYDVRLLNSTENLSKYNSNFEKALNLGVYGTDLGYTNIYEQNQDAIFYLNAIKELADGLSIGQFFNFGVIKRLATNSRNLDSLLLITTINFNNINTYLQEQQRANLSVLFLTGGWLEALHIVCKVSERNPNNQELKDRIGEQKIILESIMLLLNFYGEGNPYMSDLKDKITVLQEKFENIKITQTYEESTLKEVNGIVTIENNSTSTINITDEDVKTITEVTTSIRESIVN